MSSNYKLHTGGGLKQGAEPHDIVTKFERINTTIVPSADNGQTYVAKKIADVIRKKAEKNEQCVLALSTGRTTLGVYKELVKMHKNKEVSFRNVVVFNTYEYYHIGAEERQSRNLSLKEELLDQVDIDPKNIHFLDGTIPSGNISEYCREVEQTIAALGGIDLIVLGCGGEGQVALNEPGAYANTKTRVVALSNSSRKDLINSFYGIENTPKRAITFGIETIMGAKNVIISAWGEEKAAAIERTVEGEIDANIPASNLQEHHNIEMVVDEDAASQLTRVKTPWLIGSCIWTDKFIRKAVLWLCVRVNKPILKLTYQDYLDNYLGQLLDEVGTTFDKVNIKIFNDLQHTISGWPGGKPGSDEKTRPARPYPFPKRVVIFSPHPDDDVISMGGTFLRLVDQGHDVHVAYETSGNIAVHDDVVIQAMDSARECGLGDHYDEVCEIIKNKKKGEIEPLELRRLKGAIRRSEAKAACRHLGVNDQTNVHFLNLPFYETGSVKKGGITQIDIDIVIKLLREVQPHQIYAAGDLSDPHGTHRVCIEAVLEALLQIQHDGDAWLNDCRLWLYRGAWQEWDLDMVDMAVPLSPDEVIKKRHAIYRHLSQKDIVPFPGDDKREFWQRAEERTQNTAEMYDKLGMAEYQAIEVFVRYPL